MANGKSASKKTNEIINTAKSFFAQGKTEKAREFLGKHDIFHHVSSGTPGSDSKISPRDRYVSPRDNENTRIELDIYGREPDYSASVTWALQESSRWVSTDFVCPPDGAAIFWNENYWQPDGIGRGNFTGVWTGHEGTSGNSGSVKYGEYSPTGGILAEINDPAPDNDDGKNATFKGGFSWDIHSVKSGFKNYPLKARYMHTWKLGRCTGGLDVTLNAGAIAISGGSPKDWSMATQQKPYK